MITPGLNKKLVARFCEEINNSAKQLESTFINELEEKLLVLDEHGKPALIRKSLEEKQTELNSLVKVDPFKQNKLFYTLALNSTLSSLATAQVRRMKSAPTDTLYTKLYPKELWLYFSDLNEYLLRLVGELRRIESAIPKQASKKDYANALKELDKISAAYKKGLKEFTSRFKDVEYYFYDIYFVYEDEKVEEVLKHLAVSINEIIRKVKDADAANTNKHLFSSTIIETLNHVTELEEIFGRLEQAQEDEIYKLLFSGYEKQVLKNVLSYHRITDYLKEKLGMANDGSGKNSDTSATVDSKKILELLGTHVKDQTAAKSDSEILSADILLEKPKKDDSRIPFDWAKRMELIKDFRKLVAKEILSEDDVYYWICSEFQGFKEVASRSGKLRPRTNAANIIYFVRLLYQKYDRENQKRMGSYRAMLQKRISNCEKYNNEYLKKHFSDVPKNYDDSLLIK